MKERYGFVRALLNLSVLVCMSVVASWVMRGKEGPRIMVVRFVYLSCFNVARLRFPGDMLCSVEFARS